MKAGYIFPLIGLSLAEDSPSFPEAELAVDPVSYFTAASKLVNISNVRKLLSQIDSFPPKKIPNLTKFKPISIEALRHGLEISYMSTCPEAKITSFDCICSRDYSDISFARNLEYRANALVGYNKKTKQAIVSFRYTNGLRNWLTNFDFLLGPMPGAPKGVQVHRGMLEHYMTLHNQTMHKVTKLVKTKEVKSIFVTGYSLGGSLAVLSTPFWAHFKKEHNIPVYIMGFSGARVGNLEAKLHFESLGIPINRYTNRDDIMPQIPPRSLGYTHIGLEIHERAKNIVGSELIVCSQEYDEDPDCAWGEPGFRNPIPHLAPFNHPMVVPPYCGFSNLRINLPNYA